MIIESMAQIAGNRIPEPMASRGRYIWQPPEIMARNGRGVAVTAPYATITWSWEWLRLEDYSWWIETVLGNAASLTITSGTLLVDHLQRLVVVTGVLYRPSYEYISGGLYRRVELRIERVEINDETGGDGFWLGSGYPPTYTE